jgi:hypothetical protein
MIPLNTPINFSIIVGTFDLKFKNITFLKYSDGQKTSVFSEKTGWINADTISNIQPATDSHKPSINEPKDSIPHHENQPKEETQICVIIARQ